jgi:GR25 family glycosyltransferase involved in LPS biosynthesis
MDTKKYQFYCLSFNDNLKRKHMMEKFKKLNINCKFNDGVNKNDSRLQFFTNSFNKRQKSITYSHLSIIEDFVYKSDKDYAIICEDDILINKYIVEILEKIIKDFNVLNLDILLLGYMLPYKLERHHIFNQYPLKIPKITNSLYTYHNYPDYLSGTQMYMITKKHAQYILNKYNIGELIDKRYILDKLYIKEGNKALIYPMIAIEDKNQKDGYHILCHKTHYNEWFI